MYMYVHGNRVYRITSKMKTFKNENEQNTAGYLWAYMYMCGKMLQQKEDLFSIFVSSQMNCSITDRTKMA